MTNLERCETYRLFFSSINLTDNEIYNIRNYIPIYPFVSSLEGIADAVCFLTKRTREAVCGRQMAIGRRVEFSPFNRVATLYIFGGGTTGRFS